jgi:hypothetical protein
MITHVDSEMVFIEHETKTLIRVFSQTPLSEPEFDDVITRVFAGKIPKRQVADEPVNGNRYSCFVVDLGTDWKRDCAA